MRVLRNPLRPLYHWTLRQAERPAAEYWLYFIAFIESIFFPIPPDLLLMPILLSRPANWRRLAGLTTLFSLLGGLSGYLLAYFLFEAYGDAALAWLHAEAVFARFNSWYDAYGGLAVFAGGLSPIPYKVVALASGTFGMNLLLFLGISLLARGARFFLVAAIFARYGAPAKVWIERWFNPLSLIAIVLLALLIFLIAQ